MHCVYFYSAVDFAYFSLELFWNSVLGKSDWVVFMYGITYVICAKDKFLRFGVMLTGVRIQKHVVHNILSIMRCVFDA